MFILLLELLFKTVNFVKVIQFFYKIYGILQKKNGFTIMENNIIECPNPECKQAIEIIELNCKIFRCGIFKHTYKQINPHSPKDICDELVETGAIYGCGKPFQIVQNISGGMKAVVCGYI